MQTYYVLLHMRRHSRDARGAIINRLRSLIDVERDMIARIDVADRLFFNENTLKGVKAVVDEFKDKVKLQLYVVGIPEDEDLYMYGEADLDEFADVIEVYPNMDHDRIDNVTYSFSKAKSDQSRNDTFEQSHSINVTKVAETVEPLIDNTSVIVKPKFERSEELTTSEIEFSQDDLVAMELPNLEKVYRALDASLALDDDTPLSEVVVSQAESNLAIMRALMAEDLEDLESIDFERTNSLIYDKAKSSVYASEYIESDQELKEFLDKANEEKAEINARYEKTMRDYLEPLFKKMEEEYRSQVRDNTQDLLQDYILSIEPQYIELKNNRERKRRALSDSIMMQFAKTEGSRTAKALVKFLTLKSEITNSTIRSINKLKHSNDSSSIHDAESEELFNQRMQLEQARSKADNDLRELENARRNLEAERLSNEEAAAKRLEEIENASQDLIERQKEIESKQRELENQRREAEEYVSQQTMELKNLSEQIIQNQNLQSQNSDDAELHRNDDLVEAKQRQDETTIDDVNHNSDQDVGIQQNIKVHEIPIDISETFVGTSNSVETSEEEPTDDLVTSSVDLEEIDMSQDEIADHDSTDIVFDDDEDDVPPKSKKSKSSGRKKLSMLAKIGIGAGVGLAAVIATFGVLILTSNPDSNSKDTKTQQEAGKSKEVEPLFNVGDTLTINDTNGDSLDVVLKEFKEDGSAIAEDSNKGKWLITYEQMKDYLKQHPEKGNSSKSSDKSKSDQTTSDSKTNSSSQETKTDANAGKSENTSAATDNSVHADVEQNHNQNDVTHQSESDIKS